MPIMSWRQMYRTEYEALYEEGYPVGDSAVPDMDAVYVALDGETERRPETTEGEESRWREAYGRLVRLRGEGLRSDYPYAEPDDLPSILKLAAHAPSLDPIDDDEYARHVEGAWLGRCAGVMLGKPVEMWLRPDIEGYCRAAGCWPISGYLPYKEEGTPKKLKFSSCSPGHINGVPSDDDLTYSVIGLRMMEKHGRDFGRVELGAHWLSSLPYNGIHSAIKSFYHNYVNLAYDRSVEEQLREFPYLLNPNREGLNASIRVDPYGWVLPGDPRAAGSLAWREASATSAKNGIYASMFVAGCISAAMSRRPGMETILAGGLSLIPAGSRLAEAVDLVSKWYEESGGEWEPVCDRIYARWGHLNWAGVMFNYPLVVLSLIHGNLDFGASISTAVMCGVDTDCTAGTVGSIVGSAVGAAGIPSQWTDGFRDHLSHRCAGEEENRISAFIGRTVNLGLRFRAGRAS